MGVYIDPKGMSKTDWLLKHAQPASLDQWIDWDARPTDHVPLCVFAEPWHAILVCWFPRELRRSLPRPGVDERVRTYYYAPFAAVADALGPGTIEAMREDIKDGNVKSDLFASRRRTSGRRRAKVSL